MNSEKYTKIDDLSREFALTNEQLFEYLYLNDIKIFNENDYIDLSDSKIRELLERLNSKKKKDHKNKSGLKSIAIEGLFGKYKCNLIFENDIAIWISENGVGKTTILTMIVAILTGDARTLCDINFKNISVNISDENYIIDKQRPTLPSKYKDGIRYKYKDSIRYRYKDSSRYKELHMIYLLNDLERYLPRSFFQKIRNEIVHQKYTDSSIFDEIINKLRDYESYNNDEIDEIDQIIQNIKDLQYGELYEEIYKIKDKLKEEVVFYPTYRRVEVGFERVFSANSKNYINKELTTKYMGFGMSDVKNRIKNLLGKLRKDANTAYIEMNANIISELLEDSIANYLDDFWKIDMRKVDVVIKRIGEDRIDNIEKLRPFLASKEFDTRNSNIEFLIYYLQKLVNIYNSQEAIDKKLSKFAQVCSKYLSGKKIEYDETMLTMNVFDDDGFKIDFDDLSSGEKQIVSIFSKVYLDVTSPCIFIIDEPEISLSIEWQKEFLKDIYDSEKVALLIATTHSPFIFKNGYVDYVKELEMSKEKKNVAKR